MLVAVAVPLLLLLVVVALFPFFFFVRVENWSLNGDIHIHGFEAALRLCTIGPVTASIKPKNTLQLCRCECEIGCEC